MSSLDKDVLLLIDSHALIYRAFYAFPSTLQAANGEPTNAIYGFTALLMEVLLKFKPTHVVAVMDSKGPTIRSTEYNQYKANRKPADDLFIVQLPRVEEVINAFGIPLLKVSGYEADDIIATIDQKHSGNWARTIVVTGDRDLFQLVDSDTFVYLAGSSFSQSKLYDEQSVIEKMGVKPVNIPDFKGISGDASDNIPGVKGIGPKGAIDLIDAFGTVEEIYNRITEVPSKYQNKLIENQELALLSKKLATVDRDVPLNFEFNQCVIKSLDSSKINSIFEELRFKSLFPRLNKLKEIYTFENEYSQNLSLLDEPQLEVQTKPWDSSEVQAQEIIFLAEYNKVINPLELQFQNFYFVTKDSEEVFEVNSQNLKEFINNNKLKKLITFDFKSFIHAVRNIGLEDDFNECDDIGLDMVILKGGVVGFSLKSIFNSLGKDLDVSLSSQLLLLRDIHLEARKEINQSERLSKLIDVEKNVMKVVVEMERKGIKLDKDKFVEYENFLVKEIEKTRAAIIDNVGHEFNVKSPKQLGEVLFVEKSLPFLKKTKGGAFSTDESTLQKLVGTDPVIDFILKFREMEKLLSTYVKSLPTYIYDKTERVHATFDQMGAVSGRFSSKNPNLQNIPKGPIQGVDIRKGFIADEGSVFVSFDYSQQELRILAALAEEKEMVDSFNNELDIHKLTASEIFSAPIDAVTADQRGVGKTINFSVIYGISPFALSERLKISRQQGAEFINKYFDKYKNVRKYLDNVLMEAEKSTFTETVLGRKRFNENIKSNNRNLKSAAQRELFNFIIQGSAADIMKLAMKEFYKVQDRYPANLLLQIHDEFLFEYRTDKSSDPKSDPELLKFIKDVYNIMSNAYDIGVKYDIEASIGTVWGDMSKVGSLE